jgi:hypothetical protein
MDSIYQALLPAAEESPQQGRIRFVGRVLRSGDCGLLSCAELQGQLQGSVGQAH